MTQVLRDYKGVTVKVFRYSATAFQTKMQELGQSKQEQQQLLKHVLYN